MRKQHRFDWGLLLAILAWETIMIGLWVWFEFSISRK